MRASLRLAGVLVSLPLAAACWQSSERRTANLIDDLRSPDAAAVDRAVRQLVEMGEPAVPALIEALKDPEARVRNAAASALWSLGPKARSAVPTLAAALADSDDGVRLGAVMALESVGPDAAAAVPALSRAGAAGPQRGRPLRLHARGGRGRDPRDPGSLNAAAAIRRT